MFKEFLSLIGYNLIAICALICGTFLVFHDKHIGYFITMIFLVFCFGRVPSK